MQLLHFDFAFLYSLIFCCPFPSFFTGKISIETFIHIFVYNLVYTAVYVLAYAYK